MKETSKQKSLFKNSLFNLIRTFCGVAFPAITFSYAARLLGEEGIGQVTFSRSVIAWFSMLALLGINEYGTREAAKCRADREALSRFAHEMIMINACTTALAYVLLFFAMRLVPKLHGYEELLLISGTAIILQGLGLEWLYQSLEDYRYIAIRSIAFQVIALLSMFILVRDPDDTAGYAVITVLAAYGSYALNFFNARKYIDFKWYGHYDLRQHLRPIMWLFAMAVSVELYTVLDRTMLGFLQGDAAVGRYAAAVKVNQLVIMLIISVGGVLLPRMSMYIGRHEKQKVEILVNKAFNYVFMLSVPAAIGLFMLSNEIILLFSGGGFSLAALTMRILTPIVLIMPFSATTNNQILVPMSKEKLILRSTMTGAVTNFICNLILIPHYAENGAAIATVASETAVAVVCFFNAKKYFDVKAIFKNYYQYWLAALPIPFLVLLAKTLSIHYVGQMFLAIAASAGCYFALLYLQKNIYFLQALQQLKIKAKRE